MEKNYDDLPAEETLATPGVLDKYQAAGKIANGNLSFPSLFFPFSISSYSFSLDPLTFFFSRPRKIDCQGYRWC